MANITISNLHPAGTDLFIDSESFMRDLYEDEFNTQTGGSPLAIAGLISGLACIGVVAGVALIAYAVN